MTDEEKNINNLTKEICVSVKYRARRDRISTDKIGLVKLESNEHSYFTFIDSKRMREVLGDDSYNELVEAVETLRLSNGNGVPMYAVDNGWFFIKVAKGLIKYHEPEVDHMTIYTEALAKLLRVSIAISDSVIHSLDKTQFLEFVEDQKPRWLEEANEAIKVIEKIKGKADDEKNHRQALIGA